MAKVIQTILNLKDNMSGGLVKAAKNTKGVSKEMVSAITIADWVEENIDPEFQQL